jgi:hypothetical protein
MWNQQQQIRDAVARVATATFALAVLATAVGVRAEEPLACTTNGATNPDARGVGTWAIDASPPFEVACADGSVCTGMNYIVSGIQPDHVVVQVSADVDVEVPDERFVSGTCDKDPATGVGGACHMQTVRLNSAANKQTFALVVRGTKVVVPSTVNVDKGKIAEACRIASLGTDGPIDAFQSVAELTTISFKTCKVNIPKNPLDGAPGVASFAPDSDPKCQFLANSEPLENLSLEVNGHAVGLTRFTTDFEAGSGEGSCSTQVIRGRIYSFCTCTDANGDGIPDDPRPPCQ